MHDNGRNRFTKLNATQQPSLADCNFWTFSKSM